MKHELVWQDGVLYTLASRPIFTGTLDECAAEFPGVVIKYIGR